MRPGTFWLPFVTRGKPRDRRNVPIHGYVGPNGSGKSAAAVRDCLPSLEAGRPVVSTVRLLDYENPRPCDSVDCRSVDHGLDPSHMAPHPLWVPLNDYRQFFDLEHCDLLLDEVTGVASAREHQSMPVQIQNLLVQLRRRDVVLRWTSPGWQFADVTIRRVTQAVTVCSAYFAQERPDSMWRQRRLFIWRTYDAKDLDEFNNHKRETIKSSVRECFWGPGSDVFSAYDTRDAVLSLGAVSDAGMCIDCGGKRTMPRCSCDRSAPATVALPDPVSQAEGRDPGEAASAIGTTDSGVSSGVATPEPITMGDK